MIWPSQLNCVKGINSLVSTFLWLYYQVIRELREEVEKLRMMLKDQGGSLGGTASNPSSTQDVEMLKEKLSISENLMQEMSKTWEQKLAESEKLHQGKRFTLYWFMLRNSLMVNRNVRRYWRTWGYQ